MTIGRIDINEKDLAKICGAIIQLEEKADANDVAGGGLTISATPPSSPPDGSFWYDLSTGVLSVYVNDGTSSQWVQVSPPGGGGSTFGSGVTVSATAPGSPSNGDFWYNLTTGVLSVYINDGSSSQWVQV